MLIVKRDKSSSHFWIRDSARGNQPPTQPVGHVQRQLWFGALVFAETFLRGFADAAAAGPGMSALLTTLGGVRRINVPSEAWIRELAPHLVSGQLVVTEMWPKGREAPATREKKKEVAQPVPRKAPVVDRPPAPEASTFPPINEDLQAGALIVASQAGAAFCEVCSKG